MATAGRETNVNRTHTLQRRDQGRSEECTGRNRVYRVPHVRRATLFAGCFFAATVFASAATPASTLSVSVTVMRACAVDTRSGASGRLVISCSVGATPGLMVSTPSGDTARPPSATRVEIPAQKLIPADGDPYLMTVNF